MALEIIKIIFQIVVVAFFAVACISSFLFFLFAVIKNGRLLEGDDDEVKEIEIIIEYVPKREKSEGEESGESKNQSLPPAS